MPAPTVASLYDFESTYELALANYFANVNAVWNVLTPGTASNASANTDYLRTPRITIEFSITGTPEKRDIANNSEYYSTRTGMYTIQAVSRRNDPTENHGLLRGSIRGAMLNAAGALKLNYIPYLETADVMEASSSQSVDASNDEILTQLTYQVLFFIPPGSVP